MHLNGTLSGAPERRKLRFLRGAAVCLLLAGGLGAALPVRASDRVMPPAQSDLSEPHTMTAAQRATTMAAIKAIKAGQWSKGKDLLYGTREPLAIKLYQWLAFTRDYQATDFESISAFVKANPDWPKQGKLQLAAEKAMSANLSPAKVTAWFDHYPPQTPDGMDLYINALIATGKTGAVQGVLRGWWPKASLTPDQQARFLKEFSRYMTQDMHTARVNWSILRGQYTNARALGHLIGRGYPQLVEARIALAQGAAGVDGAVAAVPAHLKDDPGLMFERLRWRRKNNLDVGAIEILHHQPAASQIPNLDDWWKEREIIIRRLIERKQYKSAYLLASNHKQEEGVPFAEAEFLAGWLALRYTHEPWKAFEHFEALYHGTVTPISKARGAYWAGKASDALGYKDIAREWYRTAARHQTTFYGQMAVGALAEDQKPPQQVPPERTVRGEANFLSNDLTQVAKLMNEAGQYEDTTTFLDALASKSQTPETVMLAAELAQKLNHYHNAVRIAKKAFQQNIMITDYAYPTMLNYMRHADAEWALVHGLIRQESAFDTQAQSPVGARGLMQLMPATAAEVAKKAGLSHQTSWLTSKPEHNVTLGSLYISQMIRRYDGNYALALAAYNGGPGRVDRWLKEYGDPRKGEIDLVDWIEMIPISETRNYVQRVLESVYIYRLKLRDVQKVATSPIHVAMYGKH